MMRPVIKVTIWKNGCVYKTQQVGEVWLDTDIDRTIAEENAIAKEQGGDFLGSNSTITSSFGLGLPNQHGAHHG